MLRIFIIPLFCLLLLRVSASDTDSSAVLCKNLTDATKYYCSGKYRKALKVMISFRGNFPEHSLDEEVSYGIGMCYYNMNKTKYAENIFINLLYTNTRDDFSASSILNNCNYFVSDCDFRLYPELLLSIQHEASLRLAEIELDRKNFDKALKYISAADTFHRFYYGCGTDDMQEDLRLSLFYSDYYEKRKQNDSALQVLLPMALEPAAFPMKYYGEVTERIAYLLKEEHSSDEIKKIVDSAIKDIYYHENPTDNPDKPTRIYYIKILGREIQVAPAYLFGKNYNVDQVKEYIRQSEFYRLATTVK